MPFQNQVLEKLFQGILQDQPVEFKNNLTDVSVIDEAVKYLPLTLSDRQKDALYNAWKHEISYIQGPPGTGKSYTIVAIMISAILLNKKVLFVSQKKVAIDVVRRKLEEFLMDNAVIYVGSDSQERQQLRKYIEERNAEINRYDFHQHLSRQKEELNGLQNEILNLEKKLKQDASTLKQALNAENEFYKANNFYLKQRDNFIENFGQEYTKKIKLRQEQISDDSLKLIQKNINKIQEKFLSGHLLKRKEIIYIKRFLKQCIKGLNADKNKLSRDKIGEIPLYLNSLLKVNTAYAKSVLIQRKVYPRLSKIRTVVEQQEKELLDKKRQYIKHLINYQFLEKLQKDQTTAELFRKLLYWSNQNRRREAMCRINYDKLTKIFKLWAGEIKDLGQFLPFQSETFDLVIVDEASQVNIAEIIPAFYRGKSFCVVGDDKQLGLNAAGFFSLNRRFERLIWNRCFARSTQVIPFERAEEKDLIVSKSSILDFIINEDNHFSIPKVTLDEHFRSMPQLAHFTSKAFYDDNLSIMTEVGKNVNKTCFEAIEVGGQRQSDKKIIPEEIEELINKLKDLIRNTSYLQEPLSKHGFTLRNKPTIGVLSFLTNQRDAIRERLQEEFSDDEWKEYQLFVGTPEEFQGNEKNIIIMTLGLDGTSNRWAKSHYENPNRFNVATSRAINYTYFIYGGIPRSADLIKKYLRNFGYQVHANILSEPDQQESVLDNKLNWKFDELKIESEFEFRVLEYLKEFVESYGSEFLKIYNQVESCKKRLDFVIFNSQNEECCAIEVDGVHHFTDNGYTYSESHLSRVEILKRAGWKIVHIPYHKWYRKGWLCDKDDNDFGATVSELYEHLKHELALEI